MSTFLIILSCLLWIAAFLALPRRTLYAPALSYLGLLTLSFAKHQGLQILPINNIILMGWLCMTIVVMLASLMQPASVLRQTRGMGYMITGAVTGIAVGLLASTFSGDINTLYGLMIIAVVAGIFFGFLIYTHTPHGAGLSMRSGNFFSYLLAKGFPTAITAMMAGVAAVLALAVYNAAQIPMGVSL